MTNIENTNESLKKYADIHQKWEKSGMLNGLTQSQIENNTNFFPPLSQDDVNNTLTNPTTFDTNTPLLPIAIKIAAQPIGLNLVEVKPIGGVGETQEEKSKREALIRHDKIDALINEKEFTWKKEYDPKPYTSGLPFFFMDYTYDATHDPTPIKIKWYTKIWNKLKDLTFLKKF